MQQFLSQLTLGLRLEGEATFDNFYVGPNAEAVAQLKLAASAQGENILYICNPRGEGCSHLLQASCHYAHQHQLKAVYLPLANLIQLTPDILNNLEVMDLICLDDLHCIAGNQAWEEAIFHLYNRVVTAKGHLIFAANDLPRAISLKLQDLASRLTGGIIYPLHALSDNDKLAILILRAKERGIHLPEEVGKYILTHFPRQLATLFIALDTLDKASLAAQRKLTIPFVKEILQI